MEILCPKEGKVVWSPIHGSTGNMSHLLTEFEEIRILGAGAFGCVLLARNKVDKQLYAIKKVKLEEDTGYETALREVIAMATLCHPNVVRYYNAWLEVEPVGIMVVPKDEPEYDTDNEPGYDTDNDLFYDSRPIPILCIQQEVCHGSLKELMFKSLTERRIWELFRQLVEGVNYIHGRNIRHGDLSPSNIFLDESSNLLKIGDFGLASLSSEGTLEEEEVAPTTLYCAPELKRGYYSLKSDIFSLGMILLEMFANYSPSQADQSDKLREMLIFRNYQHSVSEERKWPEKVENLDAENKIFISDLVDPDPESRPRSRDLLLRLEAQ